MMRGGRGRLEKCSGNGGQRIRADECECEVWFSLFLLIKMCVRSEQDSVAWTD